jgi:hypothetical protein
MAVTELAFYTDEARLHLSGYVHSQKNRYWSADNRYSIHEVPLPDVKISVWLPIGVPTE